MKVTAASWCNSFGETGELSIMTLLALIVFSAVTPLVLLVAPAISSSLVTDLKLTPSEVGTYFFVELGAFSAASLPVYLWMHKVNTRIAAMFAILIFVAGDILTAISAYAFEILLTLRCVTALAGGTLMVLCMNTAAQSENRDRVYGLWVVGQLMAGTVGLAVLPNLFQGELGIRIFYYILAGLAMFAAPLALHFPNFAEFKSTSNFKENDVFQKPARWRINAVLGLLSVFAFYLAIGGVWTFASSAGLAAGIDAKDTGSILAMASFFGIVGAGIASVIGANRRRMIVLTLGYLLLISSLVIFVMSPTSLGYTIAAILFKFCWAFVLPFMLSCIAKVDFDNKLMTSLAFIVGLALALRPLAVGWVIQATNSLQPLFFAAMSFAAISLVCLFSLRAGKL